MKVEKYTIYPDYTDHREPEPYSTYVEPEEGVRIEMTMREANVLHKRMAKYIDLEDPAFLVRAILDMKEIIDG